MNNTYLDLLAVCKETITRLKPIRGEWLTEKGYADAVAFYERVAAAVVKAEAYEHRCYGCDHRWKGFSPVAQLCGDCWRKAQPIVHAWPETNAPASPSPINGTVNYEDPKTWAKGADKPSDGRVFRKVIAAEQIESCDPVAIDDGQTRPIGYETDDGCLVVMTQPDGSRHYHETKYGTFQRWMRQAPDLYEKYIALLEQTKNKPR